MPVDLTNPAQAIGRSRSLMSMLGSYWATIYSDNGITDSYLYAKNEAELQTFNDILELSNMVGIDEMPIFHKVNWSLLRVKQSELQEGNLIKYGDNVVFGNTEGTGIIYRYGISPDSSVSTEAPENLQDVNTITNQIFEPSVILVKNIDYSIDPVKNTITFNSNPFDETLNQTYPVYDDSGNQVDTEIHFWLIRADYDWNFLYEQFGYALNIFMDSSENYKKLISLIWDTLVVGSTYRQIEQFLALIADTPLVIGSSEIVEVIYNETDHLTIATDKNVYKFSSTAVPIVSVGQTLKQGDALVDAFKIYNPYSDTISASDVATISLGKGYLVGNFQDELAFNNTDVALSVTTDNNGKTRVEWDLGGLDADKQLFWNTVHSNGTAEGATSLAKLLDLRNPPIQSTEPAAINLPSTINPLDFLAKNVLRNNGLIIVMNNSSFGPNALQITNQSVFNQLVPVEKALFIVIKVSISDSAPMTGIGTTTTTGYSETIVSNFVAPSPIAESSPHSFIGTEGFSFTQIPD